MQFISAIFHFSLPERLAGLIPPLRFYRTWRKRHSNQYFLETSKNYSSIEICSTRSFRLYNLQPVGADDPTTSQPGEPSV